MEWMARSPGDVEDAYYDSTLNLEGREELIDNIKDKYPDEYQKTEDEVEQDRLSEAIFNEESPENQALEEQGSTEFPADAESITGLDPDPFGLDEPNIWQQTPERNIDVNQYNDNEKLAFSLDTNPVLHPEEKELGEMLKSLNLDDTLEAWRRIQADEELIQIFDSNGDGKVSFKDLFNTTHYNNGNGMTEAEDAEETKKWLESIENKSLRARIGAAFMQYPGSSRAAFVADQRQSRLAPVEEVTNWDNNAIAGVLESAVGTLNIPERAAHWMSGGKFFDNEGDRLGDRMSGINQEGSMASLMMTPAKRHFSDGIWHQVGYWGFEGLQAGVTLGFGGAGKTITTAALKQMPKGQQAAVLATRFLRPGVTTKAFSGKAGKFVGTNKWIAGPSVRAWAKNPKNLKLLFTGNSAKFNNLAWSLTKSGYLETFKGSMQRDLTYARMVGLYNEQDSIAKKLIDFHPDTWIFGSQLQYAIESPLGKHMSLWMNEGGQDAAFGGGMYGGFRAVGWVGGELLKFGPKTLGRMKTSFSQHEFSASPIYQRDFKHYWQQGQQRGRDMARAGNEQLLKNIDPENAFTNQNYRFPIELQNKKGAFKNGGTDVAQGISRNRYNVEEVIQTRNEIDGAHLTNKGSTGAILDPTDLSIAARHGVNGPIYERLTKQFIESENYAQQLKSLDPASRTVGGWSEGTLNRVKDIVNGRDAGALSPKEYWGDAFYNTPLKAGSLEELDEIQKFVAENLFVADSVNSALLSQLRDLSAVAGEQLGKQDLFAVDSVMQSIQDNLTAGLSNVKKTRLTWSLLADQLKAADGKISKEMIDEVNALVAGRGNSLHDETVDGVKLMMQMLKDSDSDELIDGILDVFKVSNDIHNWKDFDAWMHQKLVGGEFQGKVKTGALIHELQGVMVNSILSGPKTPLRAILGTTTNAYLNALNEYAGAVIRSPFTDDIIARKASAAKLKGMVELIPEAWQVFKENWNAKFTANFADIRTRYSEAPSRGDQNWQLWGKWAETRGTDGEKAAYFITNTARTLNNNKLAGWSPRALAATDDTFKWLMARARSKEIGMRQALEAAGEDWQKFSPELMKNAEDLHYRNLLDGEGNLNLTKDSWLNKQFREITLTSELGGFSKKLDGLLNETPLLKPFYLFARTGINGLNLSYKNTPLLGALHKESLAILRHRGEDFSELAVKYGIENANDLANARNLFAGRQAVGATVVTGMGMMYQAGQLTGNGPADRQLKQQWINAGWKPNHIYFGDVGFNYSSLEPFNVIFSAISDIGDNIELMGSEWAEKRLQAVAFVLGRGLTSKTYMSGLDQLMQVVQMKPGAFNKTAANVLNNSIPLAGLRNEFGKWINPHMKELNSDMWDSIRNRNQLTELAGEQKLPVKHDILNGTPINNWNIIGRSFNAVSPISLDIRSNSPGRQLLLNSNYDLKSTTYSYGGYSLADNARVRSHFQNAIGNAPIEFRGRKFKNLEKALDYLSTLPDIQTSMKTMRANTNNPAKWDVNPNEYPHNTIINRLMDQARAKAWAALNMPNHPGYSELQELKANKDGQASNTRDTRQEILEINYPTTRQTNFPK